MDYSSQLKIYEMDSLGESLTNTLIELKQLSNPTPQTIAEKSMSVMSHTPLFGSYFKSQLKKIQDHTIMNTNATEMAREIFEKLQAQENEVMEKSKSINELHKKILLDNEKLMEDIEAIGNIDEDDINAMSSKQSMITTLKHNQDSIVRIQEVQESLLILEDVIENKIPKIKARVIQNLQIHDGITTVAKTLDGYKALEALCNEIALSSQSKSNKKLLSIVADVCNDEEEEYLNKLNRSNIEFTKQLAEAKRQAVERIKKRNNTCNQIAL